MSLYRERLRPSTNTLLGTGLLLPGLFLTFYPLDIWLAIGAAIVGYGIVVAVLFARSPIVEVTETELRAGRAHIPLDELGATAIFSGDEAFRARGQYLDSRAWLCIRGWVDAVVKVQIVDEQDPTPYWLISSRTPKALVAALTKAKAARI